jgi:hypothetical protein
MLYRLAAEQHSHAINEAVGVRGSVSKEEHDRLRVIAEEARSARDTARIALRQHTQEHGC